MDKVKEKKQFSEDEMMQFTINIFGKKYRILMGSLLIICGAGFGVALFFDSELYRKIFMYLAMIIFGITYFLNKYLTHKINKKGE